MSALQQRDIRKAKWYEEIAEYFGLPETLLQLAVPPKRLTPENESQELKEARNTIREKFMSQKAIQLHNKILTELPVNITDFERSSSWKDYIFVCINGERSSFQRMCFYEQIINCVIKPMLEWKGKLVVLDYGCGSSLFTRMLSQDFKGAVQTISADVCKYAVEFSVARNKLYNPNSSGIIIEDVFSLPELREIDLILAHAVFEHLPNSTCQIQGLINALSPWGILIENYSGYFKDIPHKSDTFDPYKSRDINLDLLNNQLTLLYGTLPKKRSGVYERYSGNRFWIKDKINSELVNTIRKRLVIQNSLFYRVIRRSINFFT